MIGEQELEVNTDAATMLKIMDVFGETDANKATPKEIMEIFEDMHEKGRTIILVTHEPEIAACASRQLLVRDGQITRDEGKGVVMDVV